MRLATAASVVRATASAVFEPLCEPTITLWGEQGIVRHHRFLFEYVQCGGGNLPVDTGRRPGRLSSTSEPLEVLTSQHPAFIWLRELVDQVMSFTCGRDMQRDHVGVGEQIVRDETRSKLGTIDHGITVS